MWTQINHRASPVPDPGETVKKQTYSLTIKKNLPVGMVKFCIQLSKLNTNLVEILKSLWRNNFLKQLVQENFFKNNSKLQGSM